ncbi:MAG: hypothetical protein FJY10_12425, partial [Bacteroidetes bacterium]|nr:hypothetical protein [Bacteroidota bacterium]
MRAFYKLRYPQELSGYAHTNPALYYRLKAYFNEDMDQTDSALHNFSRAEQLMQRDPNIIGQSNFFNRFGQFLIRHNQPTEAIIQFENALRLARAASYPDYMLSAARQLEQVYLQK